MSVAPLGLDLVDETTVDAVRASDLFAQILFKTLSQRLVSELTDDHVSLPQMHAIRYVWLHQNVLMGDLASGLQISYPSATNMVKRLEKQGLAERSVNPADRREVEVSLTPRGRDLAEGLEAERVARLGRVLDSMCPADRAKLIEGLNSFIEAALLADDQIGMEVCLRCGAKATERCPVHQANTLHVCQ